MKDTFVLLWLLPCVTCGATVPQPKSPYPTSHLAAVPNEAILNLTEQLYAEDVNKASSDDIILNLQHKISLNQSRSGIDFASKRLFSYVNESKLFSRPTFAHLISLLDNYVTKTGTAETVTNEEIQEQAAFMEAIFQTAVMQTLATFLLDKGYYTSLGGFKSDLQEMWFGLYTRSKGSLDSSGFEHVFHGEIHKGKISGFHNWVQLYLLEKDGQINYLSYNLDGPWTGYPDVYAFQFKNLTYLKSLGAFFVGSSPEFDMAIYTLCYLTRPNKLCKVTFNGHTVKIQTFSWTNSSYGNGRRYIGSSYVNI